MASRLVRIDKDGDQVGGYKVSLRENPEDVTKYIALSHCWGLHQPLTTTKDEETLAARKAGIEWKVLPKTFRDAITICAGLDVNYIWIDSLCILQDDENDWGVESAKMGTIYENAWLTIAAAAAPDGTHGCFPPPLPTKEYELQLPNETTPTKIFARKLISPIDSRDHLLKTTNELPLFQRAWVFQERLLSRRILYLCEDEMAFECATNVRCECSYDGQDFIGIKYRYHSALNTWNWYNTGMRKFLPFQPTGILNVWDHFVSQFTQRRLTHDKDRLPALSGIAKMMYNTGALGEYNAGLWYARLAEGLLWFVNPNIDGFDTLPPTVGSPTAPSWSWASINGSWDYRRVSMERISLYGTDDKLYVTSTGLELRNVEFACKDLFTELYLASPNPFGGIKLGKITLTAPLTTAVISYEPSRRDERYPVRLRDQKAKLTKGEMAAEPFMDFVLDYGESPIAQGGEVFCVGILLECNSGKRNVHSLVLLSAEFRGEKVHRRIGKFLAPDGWYNRIEPQTLTII
jgi:Heterokaryon incompatibility protein (HET)